MTIYFLDSSALIKRYVQERGSEWLRSLALPESGHTWLLARATMVEVYSALARRAREGSVLAADCAAAADAFTAHSLTDYMLRLVNATASHGLKPIFTTETAMVKRYSSDLLSEEIPRI